MLNLSFTWDLFPTTVHDIIFFTIRTIFSVNYIASLNVSFLYNGDQLYLVHPLVERLNRFACELRLVGQYKWLS